MPKCCCVYSANASVQSCMHGCIPLHLLPQLSYRAVGNALIKLVRWKWQFGITELHFVDCMIIERCHPHGTVDLRKWGGTIGCLQQVYCTGGPMTFMFNVPQERRLQITVDGPIDLLTTLNALQCCCNEAHTLLAHVYIPVVLLVTDIRSLLCRRAKH